MKRRINELLKACSMLCVFVIVLVAVSVNAQPYTWTDVPRIVAISDPHGAYDAMVRTLQNAEVIDSDHNWAAQGTHLVITGDLLDRGADSRKVMDLVMRLEKQAVESGGRVHLLLGNHEVMNLVGDLRYVALQEYAAFAAGESADERERWFRIFVAQRLSLGKPDEAALRAEFDKGHPPGFFGHRQAFSSDGRYGKWLLEKPLVAVINGNAFVHGGLPPLVAELGLEGLNKTLGSQVKAYVRALGVLNRAGLMNPALNFYRHAQKAESLSVMTTLSPEVQEALAAIIELSRSKIHDASGPLWYRGNVGCSELIEGDRLSNALDAIGAERVIIGHTPTQTREVLARFDGRVIEIDTGMLNPYYKGSGHALIIENDELWVVSEHTSDLKRVTAHPRRVGDRPDDLSAANLEFLLANGRIVSIEEDDAGRTIVTLQGDAEVTISAVFTEDQNRNGVSPDLAAYRLDRLLGLDMVPITVAREINGENGSLQFVPQNTRNEQDRATSGGGGDAWCPLPEQWLAMYIFDALIFNPGRAPTNMLYNLENWQLILDNNSNTFEAKRGRPRYLKNAPLNLNTSWRRALTALDEETLQQNFADILDKRRITALAKRRDLLLKIGD